MRQLGPVSEEVQAVQGITGEERAAALTWPEVDSQLVPLLRGRELMAWNAAFARRMLRRSSRLHGLTL